MTIVNSVVLKFGLSAAAVLLTSFLCYYRSSYGYIHKVFFMMNKSCCRSTSPDTNCRNPYCKAKLSQEIIQHIDSAKHTICIAMYSFTNHHFSKALLNAKRRGVKIRIVACQSMIGPYSKINELQLKSVPVRIGGDGDNCMHNKFCLIDVNEKSGISGIWHPYNGLLITGSMNWTKQGLDKNWENVLFTSDNYLKKEYKKSFEYMWSTFA